MSGLVICGIEDSGGGEVAGVARELAGRYALPLLFVHVHDHSRSDEDVARLFRDTMATGEAELAIESGHPADRIVELAHKRDATFVVVGNHGPRSSLLGSVSAEVARRSPCPVLVVPPGTDRVELDLTPAAADVEDGRVRFGFAERAER